MAEGRLNRRADEITGSGEIVERQSFLNGTRYFFIEGQIVGQDDEWDLALGLTLPKEGGEPIVEGDLSINTGVRSWFADIVSGSHLERIDEATDSLITAINIRFVRQDGDDSTERWPKAVCTIELRMDTCDFRLVPQQSNDATLL